MAKTKFSNDLKIIGIRPKKNCHPDYLKVLKEEEIYLLYNDYKIDEKTEAISYSPSIPSKLYYQDKLHINICAIAGQNGSGKSTLMEMLFMAINNIGVNKKLNNDLVEVKKLKVNFYCLIETYYKVQIEDDDVKIFGYDSNNELIDIPIENFDMSNFFYTLAINYSLYAYNSDEIRIGQDNWLNSLFHKNDSYQTPLVIDPKRDRGVIDINSENALVRLRLIGNLLRPEENSGFNFRRSTDNLTAVKLQLIINKEKSNHILYEIPDPNNPKKKIPKRLANLSIEKDKILKIINRHYRFMNKEMIMNDPERYKITTDYLIGKLVSIAVTYKEYGDYYSISEENFDVDRFGDFIISVLKDRSHITFKLMQALNFLRYPYLSFSSGNWEIRDLSKKIHEIIKKKRGRKLVIEELVPPPIFKVDILLAKGSITEEIIPDVELIEFRTLSSGERQSIYSISSVMYHLINLDSVKRYNKMIKYRFVNIILEEVELYFHPEMQRCFIKNLLDSIQILKLKYIKGLNICFVTHSPFILSDIPDANVMFLNVIEKESKLAKRDQKTFGANIHDLLSDGFFMDKGFCGAYATEKITETINFLDYHIKLKQFRFKYENNKTVRGKDDSIEQLMANDYYLEKAELTDLFQTFKEVKQLEHLKLIQSIGEPVLAIKLLEMYDEAFKNSRREIIENQIARLTRELNKIKD